MDKFDNIGENEIRVIGAKQEKLKETPEVLDRQDAPQKPKGCMMFVVTTAIVMALIGVVFCLMKCNHQPQKPVSDDTSKPASVDEASLTPIPAKAWVEINDTMINNVSLHRFIPVNAKPKLVVGLLKEFPKEYVLGAMAADFGLYDGEYQVVGGFVHHGNMLSHSKSKYGFCALLKDTIVIGNALSTEYFEQAVNEKGDFFRQYALVKDGEVVHNAPTHNDALRRSLCRLKNGKVCIIDTDMSVSLDSFSTALKQYGVIEAVALMGSGAAVRWAVDKAGRRFISGADEYDFPDVVNYIVWENDGNKEEQ